MDCKKSDLYALEMIKALRGSMSQVDISSELGYSFNKSYRWEAGKEPLKWKDLIKIISFRRLPFTKALKKFYSFHGASSSQVDVLGVIIKNQNTIEMAEQIGVSKHVLYRYLRGDTEIKLQHFLKIMGLASPWFFNFWQLVLGKRYLPPSFSKEIKKLENGIKVKAKYPYVPIVQRLLDLERYKKSKTKDPIKYLKKNYKIDFEGLEDAFEAMLASGLMEKDKGVFKPVYSNTGKVDNVEANINLIEYFLEQAARSVTRLRQKERESSHYNYHSFSCDKKTFGEVKALTMEYWRAVNELIYDYENKSDGKQSSNELYILAGSLFDPRE